VRLESLGSDSVFPPEEAPSVNSRPTPLVPASQELRALGMRSHPPALDSREAREMMITRPDGLAHSEPPDVVISVPPSLPAGGERPSSRPTASFGPARHAENAFFEATAAPPNVQSLPPVGRPRHRSRARAIFAKVLFVTIFAGVATLLGFAIKKKLEMKKIDSVSALVR
jgi:hypothetical protein